MKRADTLGEFKKDNEAVLGKIVNKVCNLKQPPIYLNKPKGSNAKLTEKRENETLKTDLSIDEIDYHVLKKEKTARTIRMHQFKKRMK